MDLVGLDVNLAAAHGDLGGPGPPGAAAALADPGRARRRGSARAQDRWRASTGTATRRSEVDPQVRSAAAGHDAEREAAILRADPSARSTRRRRLAVAEGVATARRHRPGPARWAPGTRPGRSSGRRYAISISLRASSDGPRAIGGLQSAHDPRPRTARSARPGSSRPSGRPIGRYGGALAGVRPDDLAAARHPGRRRPLRASTPALIEDVILGCANQAGEDNRNVARMARAAGRPAGRGRRPDRQPAVRQRAPGDQLGRPRDRGRRRRRVHRRRRRIDDPGAVRDGQARGRLGPRHRASSRTRRSAGASSTRSSPSCTTRTRWARPPRTSPSAGTSGASSRTPSRSRRSSKAVAAIEAGRFDDQIVPDRGAPAKGRADRGRPATSTRAPTPPPRRSRGSGRRSGRAARSRPATLRDQRRRVGGAAGRGRRAPASSASGRWPGSSRRPSPASTRRSWASAPCRPPARRSSGPGIARRRPRPRRAQRGVRLPVDRLHQRARPRSGQGQRQRRRDRARPPARDERRPADHDAGPRAAPDRRPLRAGDDVHRRGAGDRHGHRAHRRVGRRPSRNEAPEATIDH